MWFFESGYHESILDLPLGRFLRLVYGFCAKELSGEKRAELDATLEGKMVYESGKDIAAHPGAIESGLNPRTAQKLQSANPDERIRARIEASRQARLQRRT